MKNIKVGVFGAARGVDIAKNMMLLDCEIVALCDSNEKRRNEGLEKLGVDVEVFSDFDEFIKTEMDAVIIANYFHEHAPFAIKCFERNIHVFCECISNGTMAEGVELVRAFEKSNSIFMLAENYPQIIGETFCLAHITLHIHSHRLCGQREQLLKESTLWLFMHRLMKRSQQGE